MLLRQSTDAQQVALGPLMQWDDNDEALIPYTGTVANTDIRVLKSGAESEVSKDENGATHIVGGLYRAVLNASDTDTLGPISIRIGITGVEPFVLRATVVPAAVYDALVAGTGAGVRSQSINLESQAAAVLAAATVAGGIRADMWKAKGEELMPATDIAKESSVQQAITAINGIEPGGSPTGPGGIPVIIPVTSNNQPVDGAAVWITTDPEGTNQIAGVIHTNTFGNTNPAFTLEAGIFYVWVQKAGINFPNPQAIQVLENGTYQWYTN